jgi:hypothetical protein
VSAQLFAEQPDELAAPRRRHQAPGAECFIGAGDLLRDRAPAVGLEPRDLHPVDRRTDDHIAGRQRPDIDAQALQQRTQLSHENSLILTCSI